MKLISLVLGIGTFILFSASLAAYALVPDPSITYGIAAAGAAFALGWAAIHRQALAYFFLRKSTRQGANLAFVVFLVLGILVFVNILGKEFSWRKDITSAGALTLSPQTLQVLKGLSQDVKVYYVNTVAQKDPKDFFFKGFQRESKHFLYEFVDAGRRPTLVQSLDVKKADTIVFELVGTNKRVKVEGSTEEKVTNGLIKLLRAKEQVVYFSTGHGERSLEEGEALGYSTFRAELEKQGYTVKELSLVTAEGIPADAAALVIAGAQRVFAARELEAIRQWLKNGGRLWLAVDLDPQESGLAKGSRQLADLVKEFGVTVNPQMLVDPTSREAKEEPQVLVGLNATKDHPITKDFPLGASAGIFFFPLTTHLTLAQAPEEKITALARTTPNAWAESNWQSLRAGAVSYQAGQDQRGQLTLAAAVERDVQAPAEGAPKPRSARLVVFGTSAVAVNALIDRLSNRDLVLNALSWLVDDESLISIRAKEEEPGLRNFNNQTLNVVFFLAWIGLPVLLALMAFYVWWRRSKL